MVDAPIFLIGLAALSIVIAAVRAISREDLAARDEIAALALERTPPVIAPI